MNWKGKELNTFGDLMEHGIDKCATKEEAQEFMKLYVAESPDNARSNIGYASGYYSTEDARRIREWFKVSHPIFGTTEPTPEEAFAMGQAWAEASKRKKDGAA